MAKLSIKATDDTPDVKLDAEQNIFELNGMSTPENANLLFNPIIEWFKIYFEKPNSKTVLKINLEYINSSSSRKIIEILMLLEEQFIQGKAVEIEWLIEKNDISMEESGNELLSLYEIPYKIIKH